MEADVKKNGKYKSRQDCPLLREDRKSGKNENKKIDWSCGISSMFVISI